MEPIFVNECEHSERNLRELNFASRGKFRAVLYTIVGIFGLITAVMMMISVSVSRGLPLLLMSLLLFFIAYAYPIIAARQQAKRNQLLSAAEGGSIRTVGQVSFFDDRVVTTNPSVDKELTFTYDQFKKIKQTRHLWLLRLPQNLYLLIDREGFTVGNPDEFEAFIKGKLGK